MTKRILALLMALVAVLFSFVGCASKPYDYELDEYLELPSEWKNVSVTNEEVAARSSENIRKFLEQHIIITEEPNAVAANGDLVHVSFICYLASDYGKEDASPINELSDPDCKMVLGREKYPFDLERGIRGHYKNDKLSVRLTLPSDFGLEAYAGEGVVFDVTVLSVFEYDMPKYDDAFIASVTSYSTVAEYEKIMQEKARKELLWEKIVSISELKLAPETELGEYERDYVGYYTKVAADVDCTLEEYISRKFFSSITKFHVDANAYAKDMVKKDLLLYQFIRVYGLEPSDDEYRIGAEKYAKEQGLESVSALEAQFGTDYVRKSIAFDKVLDYIDAIVLLNEGENKG